MSFYIDSSQSDARRSRNTCFLLATFEGCHVYREKASTILCREIIQSSANTGIDRFGAFQQFAKSSLICDFDIHI